MDYSLIYKNFNKDAREIVYILTLIQYFDQS